MNALIIILGLLPGFAWLLFYLQEDNDREPKKAVALAFAAGALSAVAALVVELFINCSSAYRLFDCLRNAPNNVELTTISVFVFAVVEEIAKFGAVYFAISKTRYFDEPIDAMIYMAVAALGFATVENLGAVSDLGKPVLLDGLFQIATFRLIGTTLLHTLTASTIGYFWALGIRNFKSWRFIVYGLILASALHAAFNYLILIGENLIYPIVFVTLIGFFVLSDFEKLKGKKI